MRLAPVLYRGDLVADTLARPRPADRPVPARARRLPGVQAAPRPAQVAPQAQERHPGRRPARPVQDVRALLSTQSSLSAARRPPKDDQPTPGATPAAAFSSAGRTDTRRGRTRAITSLASGQRRKGRGARRRRRRQPPSCRPSPIVRPSVFARPLPRALAPDEHAPCQPVLFLRPARKRPGLARVSPSLRRLASTGSDAFRLAAGTNARGGASACLPRPTATRPIRPPHLPSCSCFSLKMAAPRLSLRLPTRAFLSPRTFARPVAATGFWAASSNASASSSSSLGSRRTLISTASPTDAPPVTLESAAFEGAPQPVRSALSCLTAASALSAVTG